MSCIRCSPPCLPRSRPQTSLLAASQAPAIRSERESCWRPPQKGPSQSAAPASQARGPRFHSAWARGHAASRRVWLQTGGK